MCIALHSAHDSEVEAEAEATDADNSQQQRRTPPTDITSRRRLISSVLSSASAGTVLLSSGRRQSAALAAPPLTSETADDLAARVERGLLRPKPARVLRPRLNLDFAVLLMRSSYNAVDDIDVVAMDQFQRDFFLIRQAEYKAYADSLGATMMMQGDLADPNYFDFISFAQYATISREIASPASVFEEQQPVAASDEDKDLNRPQRFNTVVVRRDPSLATNADLRRRHTEIVGNEILDKLVEKFGTTASAIPKIEPGSRPDANVLLAAIKQMVNLFVVSGFAWDGNASMANGDGDGERLKRSTRDAAGAQFTLTFTSPATLWSGQSLGVKRGALSNDFALKAARAMVSRAGYVIADASVKYTNNQEVTTFTIM